MERRIVEECYRERKPLPPKIENAPDLDPGLELYWDAFLDLSTCRQLGFGAPGPIPWTAVRSWWVAHRLNDVQGFRLTCFIRRMDQEFLAWHGRKNGGKSGVQSVRPPDGGGLGRGR